jgi:hypothetical protein
MKKLKHCLFVLLPGFAVPAAAGDSLPPPKYDTTYIAKYFDKLVLGLYQSARRYDILMEQFVTQDTLAGKPSNANYFADANNVTGFSFDYDIIGFSFALKSASAYPESKVGKTTYYSYGVSFTTKGLRLENSIKKYRGFYDKHSPVYDTAFSDTTKYFQNPSMSIFTYKTKAIYTFKKRKFALSSSYANVSRQLKSAFSWILVGNVYMLDMRADSSLVPKPIQPFYGTEWDDMNRMKVLGFSAGGGPSGTLVIKKKFFVNFLLSLGLEAQHRAYSTRSGDASLSIWQPSLASDWRFSIGYNGPRFFMRLSNIVDYNYFYTDAIHISQKFISGEFSFGYRFKVKTPKLYRKFQDTKIYSYF